MVVVDVSTIILASVILFTIIAIIANRTNKRRINTAGKTLLGPPRWPLIGNICLLTHKVEDILDMVTSFFDSYPSIYQLRIGPFMIININDPDICKSVLVDHKLVERSFAGMLFNAVLGTGLVTARLRFVTSRIYIVSYAVIDTRFAHVAAIWRLHRKIIGPTFNSTFLRNFIDVFDTQSKIMVEQLKMHQDGPEFDMEHYISRCIFDIINETAMDVKLGTQTNHEQIFKTAMDSIIEIGTMRFFMPWLHPDFLFNLSPLGVRNAGCVRDARGFAKRIIKKQMEEMSCQRLRPEVVDHEEHAETSSNRRKTLLNLLMNWKSGEMKLQNEEIIDELITISVTATDTTATATNMLMLALACYPDVQKKVYEEVTEVCGNGEDDGQTITVDQLSNLVYLDRVIKEILRLFPIVNFAPRDVVEDITIGDYHIPKDAVIIIAIFALHKNEQFWPDPLKFDPDRFLPEEVAKRHVYAYMPFGAGPRNCIGEKFAMMSMKMICAKVAQKYALEKDLPKNIADTKMKIGITMKACDPITVRIRKRLASIAKA